MKKRRLNKKGLLSLMLAFCMIVTSLVFTPKKAEAAGSYWIKVNRKMNTVTVYQYKNGTYKPVKAMVCSVGRNKATPLGNFNTQGKYRWHVLNGPVYGQYCTRIYKGYLFHSVWYFTPNKNAQSTKEYNRLGKDASHGCVRLTVADAKWLYDHCPTGTRVTIYDDSSSPGPLGKPKAMKVSRSKKQGWDPTDPDPNNPFKKYKPSIKFSSKKAKKVALYSEYDPKTGVSARDHKKRNITDRITVSGKVNTKKPGTYKLTYMVKDHQGYVASREFKVTVEKSLRPLIIGAKSSVTLKIGNSYVDAYMKRGMGAVDRDGTVITKNMKLTCSDPNVRIVTSGRSGLYGKTRFYKPGRYKLYYTITGSKKNGRKTTRKYTIVNVLDDSTPSINVANAAQTVNLDDIYGDAQIRAGVTASTFKATNLTSKITYTITTANGQAVSAIDTKTAGDYVIKYSVTSPTGRVAYNTRTVSVKDLSDPMVVLTGNSEITIAKALSTADKEAKMKEGVQFRTAKGTDLSANWSYEIHPMNGDTVLTTVVPMENIPVGRYTVYLRCKNPNTGKETSTPVSRIINIQ